MNTATAPVSTARPEIIRALLHVSQITGRRPVDDLRVEKRSYSSNPWRIVTGSEGLEVSWEQAPFEHPLDGQVSSLPVMGYRLKRDAVAALDRCRAACAAYDASPEADRILAPEWAEFAGMLRASGFRTYVFTSDVKRVAAGGREAIVTHLAFSREVEGRECWGSVSRTVAGCQFSMPMKPSRAHGSSMFIGGDRAEEFDALTVENATLYASPFGRNALVGTHANDSSGVRHLYTEVVR